MRCWNVRTDPAGPRALPASERRRVLADVAVTEAELPHLYRGAHHAQELLPSMMKPFGLDPDQIRRQRMAVFRDLQRLCSSCTETSRCAHAARDRAGVDECRRFCPNASTLYKLTENRTALQACVVRSPDLVPVNQPSLGPESNTRHLASKPASYVRSASVTRPSSETPPPVGSSRRPPPTRRPRSGPRHGPPVL